MLGERETEPRAGVDRLPSGSYRARLMVDGQTYSSTFATEAEAHEWLTRHPWPRCCGAGSTESHGRGLRLSMAG
jgi:hypothetical protein